jgi:hypothetical protein
MCLSTGWLQLGTKCYTLVMNKSLRWDEAAMHCRKPECVTILMAQSVPITKLSCCRNGGGQLGTLDNWILTRYLALNTTTKGPFWLGFKINDMNSTVFNTPQMGQSKSIYNSLWSSQEPNLRSNDPYCVTCTLDYANDTSFGWAIDNCNNSKPFICETIACFNGNSDGKTAFFILIISSTVNCF